MASSSMGSANWALMSSYSRSKSTVSCTPSSTISLTVLPFSNSGSCSRYPTVNPGWMLMSPSYSPSMPAIIRNSVLFPDPFKPNTPILAP